MSGSIAGAGHAGSIGIEHIDGLFGYALALTRNRTEAEDLVQETYVRALDAAGRLRENSNIKAWLFTILRNLWLNELRRRHSGPQIVEIDSEENAADGLAGASKNSHEIFVSNEDAERVRTAIAKLPIEFKETVALYTICRSRSASSKGPESRTHASLANHSFVVSQWGQ